jgi:hypothetical protein
VWVDVLEALQAEALDPTVGEGAPLLDRHAHDLEPDFDVAQKRAPRQKRILLEHIAQPVSGVAPPVDADLAVEVHSFGIERVADEVEDRRFPAPRGADERDDLAVGHREIDAFEHTQRVGAPSETEASVCHHDFRLRGASRRAGLRLTVQLSVFHVHRFPPIRDSSPFLFLRTRVLEPNPISPI